MNLDQARKALAKAVAAEAAEWWRPSRKKAVLEARRRLARIQRQAEDTGEQYALPLEDDTLHTPDAFK
jgi:urease accessory protein UreE